MTREPNFACAVPERPSPETVLRPERARFARQPL